jgi:hypothetical protein
MLRVPVLLLPPAAGGGRRRRIRTTYHTGRESSAPHARRHMEHWHGKKKARLEAA